MLGGVGSNAFFDQGDDTCRVGDRIIFIGGLEKASATVVKVVVWHVIFDHTYDAFSVRNKFGFGEKDNIGVSGPNVTEEGFP